MQLCSPTLTSTLVHHSPLTMLQADVPALLKAVAKQLRDKSPKTKVSRWLEVAGTHRLSRMEGHTLAAYISHTEWCQKQLAHRRITRVRVNAGRACL